MAAVRNLISTFTLALAMCSLLAAQQPQGTGPLFRNMPPDPSALPESQPQPVKAPPAKVAARPVTKNTTQPNAARPTEEMPVPSPTTSPRPAQRTAAPARPEQMPANAPRVSFQSGQLTVVAENSTFADVVSAIRAATGIKLESTGGLSSDRIAAKIGPAPVKDVLLSLFDGSRYDYVIVGSMTDPNAVTQVVLTPRSSSGGSTAVAGNNRPQPQLPVVTHDEMEDGPLEDGEAEGFAPEQKPPQQQDQAQPVPQQNANPGGVKTPQQLLEDLRRMERERQQRANPNERNPQETRPQ